MPADRGKQNCHGKPEADINDAEAKVNEKPRKFCPCRNKPGGDQPDGSDQEAGGKYHDQSEEDARQEFSDDDIIPIERLAHQPVQGCFRPLLIASKPMKMPIKGPISAMREL